MTRRDQNRDRYRDHCEEPRRGRARPKQEWRGQAGGSGMDGLASERAFGTGNNEQMSRSVRGPREKLPRGDGVIPPTAGAHFSPARARKEMEAVMHKSFDPPADMSAPPKDPETLTVNELRQGETGHGVRYVLVISLSAALVALVAAWAFVI
ncbi:MAG: hypothetical protein IT566_10390 [Rhodospirillaceae bacterium]|nr:hypothetical protein [Rhodospirillaceae bacterium]